MSVSTKHPEHSTQSKQGSRQSMPSSSELPSSQGNSPKRVTPRDITPDDATWKDLRVADVGSDRIQHGMHDQAAFIAGRQASGDDTSVDMDVADLPSSAGDAPICVTPKDVTPDNAAWSDLKVRSLPDEDVGQHQEASIDESSELSFPASDPPAPMPESTLCEKVDACAIEMEEQLDEAIEMTFPASDPIAVSLIAKLCGDKSTHRR